MIAMGVGDDDVRHRLAAHRIKQRGRVAFIAGARVDDRDLAAANDVAQRPLEGERAWIVGEDTPHAGRDVIDDAWSEVESAIERDVFGHCCRGDPCGRPVCAPSWHSRRHQWGTIRAILSGPLRPPATGRPQGSPLRHPQVAIRLRRRLSPPWRRSPPAR